MSQPENKLQKQTIVAIPELRCDFLFLNDQRGTLGNCIKPKQTKDFSIVFRLEFYLKHPIWFKGTNNRTTAKRQIHKYWNHDITRPFFSSHNNQIDPSKKILNINATYYLRKSCFSMKKNKISLDSNLR